MPEEVDDAFRACHWANPSISLSTEPALVATIYFRTKESSLDAKDEAVLLCHPPFVKRAKISNTAM